MYFVAKIHEIIYANDAYAAALIIRSSRMTADQAIRWISDDKQYYYYAVPNGPLTSMLDKLDILKQRTSKIPSYSTHIGWIANNNAKTATELGKYLKQAETSRLVLAERVMIYTDKP